MCEGRFSGEAHSKEGEAVAVEIVHGAGFALIVGIFSQSKIGAAKNILIL